MAQRIESLRGMEDILPGEIEKWQWLESRARAFFDSRGYSEIRTPAVEYTELFSRSIGETTDIVHKEMYTFEDRGGRSLTLRPEMTASVARSVLQNGLLKTSKNLRLYYTGPMFRAERPQAGRKRQFHQIGAEFVNESGTPADFEIITLLYDFLKFLKLTDVKLRINDLSLISGSASEQIRGKLRDYFLKHKDKLDKDSLYRLDKNVLRIFDSKAPELQPVLSAAPWDEIAPLSAGFSELTAALKDAGIPYELSRRLVRGLDYYTGVVFEIASGSLGAQDALAGGGRYDRLYGELAGPETPCTGFSIGMERLMMALESNNPALKDQVRERFVYVAPLEEGIQGSVFQMACRGALELAQAGFRVHTGPAGLKPGDHLKRASKYEARFCLLIGSEETAKQIYTLKLMDSKEQKQVAESQLVSTLLAEMKGH